MVVVGDEPGLQLVEYIVVHARRVVGYDPHRPESHDEQKDFKNKKSAVVRLFRLPRKVPPGCLHEKDRGHIKAQRPAEHQKEAPGHRPNRGTCKKCIRLRHHKPRHVEDGKYDGHEDHERIPGKAAPFQHVPGTIDAPGDDERHERGHKPVAGTHHASCMLQEDRQSPLRHMVHRREDQGRLVDFEVVGDQKDKREEDPGKPRKNHSLSRYILHLTPPPFSSLR